MNMALKTRRPGQIAALITITAALGAFAGCAALIPERAPLEWSVEGLARQDEPGTGDVRWTYALVIENPGRVPATLVQEAEVLGWDGVYLSPAIEQTARRIEPRGRLRLPTESIFRRGHFEARQQGSPGRPPNAPTGIEGMSISWQFLGRYEGGGAIILNIDVPTHRRR